MSFVFWKQTPNWVPYVLVCYLLLISNVIPNMVLPKTNLFCPWNCFDCLYPIGVIVSIAWMKNKTASLILLLSNSCCFLLLTLHSFLSKMCVWFLFFYYNSITKARFMFFFFISLLCILLSKFNHWIILTRFSAVVIITKHRDYEFSGELVGLVGKWSCVVCRVSVCFFQKQTSFECTNYMAVIV